MDRRPVGDAAEVSALALAGPPGDPNIVLQTTLQNSLVISDLPGPTGGIMLNENQTKAASAVEARAPQPRFEPGDPPSTRIIPAELVFLTPDIPDALILIQVGA